MPVEVSLLDAEIPRELLLFRNDRPIKISTTEMSITKAYTLKEDVDSGVTVFPQLANAGQ
ncbi:hypothetical protein [Agarivorans sp. DSG3-1]|uniref:hypothetical protein n=1 Tax=Agarivorans sp. DSG3-1 TaxID=3342249 RepID=UPI00398F184E